jgi:hypothetical protein
VATPQTQPATASTPPLLDFSDLGAKPAAAPGLDFSDLGAKPFVNSSPAKQPSAWQVLTQPTDKTDKEYLGYTGPAGVVGATVHGLNDVARGTIAAAKGAAGMFDPRTQPGENAFTKLPIVRGILPLLNAAKKIPQIPAAVKDINQSSDPTGAYLNAAQDTASQGAGQALTAIAAEAAPKALAGTSEIVRRTVPPVVRGVAKGTNTLLEEAPGGIGMAAGGAIGHAIGRATGIPHATTIGGGFGYALGNELLPKLHVPGEDFGLPKPVYPDMRTSPADAPTGEFVDSAPTQPETTAPFAPAQVVEPKLLPAQASGASRRVPGEIAPEDVNAPDASTLAGKQGIRVVLPGKPKLLAAAPEETATAQPTAAPPVNTAPSALANLLNRGLGYEPPPKPMPGKPIYQRPTASTTSPAPPVPEGMTPVQSAGMRAYSYDAPSQTFTAQWPDGTLHKYGEVTPEEVQAFESAKSKGRALLDIKNNHVHVAANYGKGWVNKAAPLRSAAPESATATSQPIADAEPSAALADEDLAQKLQQSLKQAEGRKTPPRKFAPSTSVRQ